MHELEIMKCRLSDANVLASIQKQDPTVFFLADWFFQNTFFSNNGTLDILKAQTTHQDVAQHGSFCVTANEFGVEEPGRRIDTIKLPDIHESHKLAPCDVMDIEITKGGQLLNTYPQKWQYAQTRQAMEEMHRLKMLAELQAAEILAHGQVTIEGKSIPTQRIDFDRNQSLNVVCPTDMQWCQADSKPFQQIQKLSRMTIACTGRPAKDWLLTPAAWEALLHHQDFQDMLDRQRQSMCVDCSNEGPMGAILPEGMQTATGMPGVTAMNGDVQPEFVQFLGSIGEYNFFLYDAPFYQRDNATGEFTDTPLIADGDIIGIDRQGFQGTKAFGAIPLLNGQTWNDPTFYFYSHECKNPLALETVYMSRKMLIPGNVNAFVRATVASDCVPEADTKFQFVPADKAGSSIKTSAEYAAEFAGRRKADALVGDGKEQSSEQLEQAVKQSAQKQEVSKEKAK